MSERKVETQKQKNQENQRSSPEGSVPKNKDLRKSSDEGDVSKNMKLIDYLCT